MVEDKLPVISEHRQYEAQTPVQADTDRLTALRTTNMCQQACRRWRTDRHRLLRASRRIRHPQMQTEPNNRFIAERLYLP
jgi:hypothetical protein